MCAAMDLWPPKRDSDSLSSQQEQDVLQWWRHTSRYIYTWMRANNHAPPGMIMQFQFFKLIGHLCRQKATYAPREMILWRTVAWRRQHGPTGEVAGEKHHAEDVVRDLSAAICGDPAQWLKMAEDRDAWREQAWKLALILWNGKIWDLAPDATLALTCDGRFEMLENEH